MADPRDNPDAALAAGDYVVSKTALALWSPVTDEDEEAKALAWLRMVVAKRHNFNEFDAGMSLPALLRLIERLQPEPSRSAAGEWKPTPPEKTGDDPLTRIVAELKHQRDKATDPANFREAFDAVIDFAEQVAR